MGSFPQRLAFFKIWVYKVVGVHSLRKDSLVKGCFKGNNIRKVWPSFWRLEVSRPEVVDVRSVQSVQKPRVPVPTTSTHSADPPKKHPHVQ